MTLTQWIGLALLVWAAIAVLLNWAIDGPRHWFRQ